MMMGEKKMGNRAQRRSKDRAVLDYLLVQDVVLQYSVAIAMVLRIVKKFSKKNVESYLPDMGEKQHENYQTRYRLWEGSKI